MSDLNKGRLAAVHMVVARADGSEEYPSGAWVALEEVRSHFTSDTPTADRKAAALLSDMIENIGARRAIKGHPFLTEKLKEQYNELAAEYSEMDSNLVSAFDASGLGRLYRTLEIDSSPRTADVFLNGVRIGFASQPFIRMPNGEHKLRLEEDGYEPWETNVASSTDEFERVRVSVKLRPMKVQAQAGRETSARR
jgi:hypothetical protein